MTRMSFTGLCLVLLSACGGGSGSSGTTQSDGTSSTPQTAVVAHRGGAAYAPENSIMAFDNARRIGADIIEMDVRMTADGVLAIFHDRVLERVTDCSGQIESLSFLSLLSCDSAYYFLPGLEIPFSTGLLPPLRGQGQTIPQSQALLQALANAPGSELLLEIKTAPPAGLQAANKLVSQIESFELADRVILQSYYRENLNQARTANPQIRRQLLAFMPDQQSGLELLESALSDGLHSLAIVAPTDALNLEFIQAARLADIEVFAGTFNSVEDLDDALALGLAGIITDYPACLLGMQQRATAAKVTPEGLPDTATCPDSQP